METTGELGFSIHLPEFVEGLLVDARWHFVKLASTKGENDFLVVVANLAEMGRVVLQLVSVMFWVQVSLERRRVRS
jgi:hypothetical protein